MIEENQGVAPSSRGRATGLRPQPPSASSQSSVPNAGEVLDTLRELTLAVAKSEALLNDDRMWGAFSRAVNIIAKVAAAQGIEARQRHDPEEGRGPKDESPVAVGDAPKASSPSSSPNQYKGGGV